MFTYLNPYHNPKSSPQEVFPKHTHTHLNLRLFCSVQESYDYAPSLQCLCCPIPWASPWWSSHECSFASRVLNLAVRSIYVSSSGDWWWSTCGDVGVFYAERPSASAGDVVMVMMVMVSWCFLVPMRSVMEWNAWSGSSLGCISDRWRTIGPSGDGVAGIAPPPLVSLRLWAEPFSGPDPRPLWPAVIVRWNICSRAMLYESLSPSLSRSSFLSLSPSLSASLPLTFRHCSQSLTESLCYSSRLQSYVGALKLYWRGVMMCHREVDEWRQWDRGSMRSRIIMMMTMIPCPTGGDDDWWSWRCRPDDDENADVEIEDDQRLTIMVLSPCCWNNKVEPLCCLT